MYPKKILLIRFSSLGDVILTNTLISALRKKYPDSQIDFLTSRECAGLVKYHPGISSVTEFDKKKGFSELKRIRSELLARRYDAVADLQGNLRSRYIRRGLGKKTGVIRKNLLIRFLLLKFRINLYKKIYKYIPTVTEKYFRAAAFLKPEQPHLSTEIYPDPEAQKKAAEIAAHYGPLGFHAVMAPGAKHFTKRWPAHHFAGFIEWLHNHYEFKTILVGGPDEHETAEQIVHLSSHGTVLNLCGRISLQETISLIGHASVFVSNDSALMHAAAAFRIPQIAVFGSTVREFGFFPQNPNAYVAEIPGLKCRPCTHIGRAECPEGHFHCMECITPQHLAELTEQFIKPE